jgi:hypothetical protein
MPFREKSAWIMTLALLLGGFVYFRAAGVPWSESDELASPEIPMMLAYAGILVAVAVAGHIISAALAPKDAHAPVDERERQIFNRAGHYSSFVTGFGVVTSLGMYILMGSGDLLFYSVFASLLAGQIAEYALQILFYRTSI